MFMVIRKSNASVPKITGSKIATDYITKDISEQVALAVIEGADYDEKETTDVNRIYYIFDGQLQLFVRDKEAVLYAGDAFFIEKGMTYEMKGTFKAIAVNQPGLRI